MFGPMEPKGADARIKDALEECGLGYTLSENFNFSVIFKSEDRSRVQVVVVQSRTFEVAGYELRKIKSAAAKFRAPLDSETISLFLTENERLDIGTWSFLKEAEGEYMALFSVVVSASLDAIELHGIMRYIAQIADDMEENFSEIDAF